jgi:hypothetical protein
MKKAAERESYTIPFEFFGGQMVNDGLSWAILERERERDNGIR